MKELAGSYQAYAAGQAVMGAGQGHGRARRRRRSRRARRADGRRHGRRQRDGGRVRAPPAPAPTFSPGGTQVVCGKCGAKQPGGKFCAECGSPLVAAEEVLQRLRPRAGRRCQVLRRLRHAVGRPGTCCGGLNPGVRFAGRAVQRPARRRAARAGRAAWPLVRNRHVPRAARTRRAPARATARTSSPVLQGVCVPPDAGAAGACRHASGRFEAPMEPRTD